jgi:transposase InsO family protein
MDNTPQVIPLDRKHDISLADPNVKIHTDGYVLLTITFQAYDSLTLRDRTFFVVQQDVGQPIIGHHELEELGIDPNSTLERLTFSSTTPDTDIGQEEPESIVGQDAPQSLDMAIQHMLLRARQNNMPESWWRKLCKLVKEYKDIFRVQLLDDPPADVTPMQAVIKPGKEATTWNTYNRKYTQEELKWLKNHLQTLEKYGFVYRNPHARYASPALVVGKPGSPGEFRLCVDVKKPNDMVMQTHWPMPHIDIILKKLARSSVFAKLDAFKGYWLFPVTPECGELYSIKTPFGVFTPRRIIQGAQEAVKYFQAGMEEALEIEQRDDILLWVDDILSHGSTPRELIESLAHIFRCCRNRRIRLSAKKCDLYLRRVTWCGRTISSDGVGFDPEYIQGVLNLDVPKTVGDLQQYVCSLNWIRSSIPHYNKEVEPLSECLREIVGKVGSNKKRILSNRKLSLFQEWDDKVMSCYLRTKELLKSTIISTHYDPTLRLCVFPDASDDHWGLFITQVPHEDLSLPYEQQRHRPLSMMSGTFRGSSKRWHIKEKEAFPIMVALEKARDMLKNPDGFSLFTDHKNLVWVLDPGGRQVVKHADDRLSRWSLMLMTYKFSVEHIPGESNVVADMLSRWRTEYPQTVCGARFEPGNCSTIHKEDFQWPTLDQVARLQGRLTDREIALFGLTPVILKDVSILVTKSKRIFVPDDENLRVRLCVIAHAGLSGHRGIDTTYSMLKKFFWPKMYNDVKNFCRLCLHCSVADPRKVIPRPLGEQMHASTRNQILHYDFMHVGISDSGSTYLLVIKDDFSGFVDLVPCDSPTGDVVVNALLRWYGLFGVSLVHVSDQGTHFKNSVVSELNRRLTTKHHFTLPYAPWSNGTVEVVNKEIRKLIRVWISEFRITLKQWPSLIPLMMHVLNFSPSPRLHGYPPALVFGGFTTTQNIGMIFHEEKFFSTKATFDVLSQQVEKLRESLELLHRKLVSHESRRGNHSLIRNRPNFDKGDFVMFATRRFDTGPSRRSVPRWTGPYRVLECISDWEFVIQHLVTNDKFSAHCSRLKYYCDKDLNVTADLKFQITHDEMRYRVSRILNHRVVEGCYEFFDTMGRIRRGRFHVGTSLYFIGRCSINMSKICYFYSQY